MNDKQVITEMLEAIDKLYLLKDCLQDKILKDRIDRLLSQARRRISDSAEYLANDDGCGWDTFSRDKEKYLAP